MPQADYTVSASQSGSAYASDVNNALLAIQTNNSGSTAPSDLDAFMGWADTTTNFFKTRDAGNTTWYTQFPLNKNLSTYINELVLVHGLGGTAPLKSGDDLNSVDQTGFYRITTGTTNNTYGNGSVLVVNRGSGVVDQLILSITDSKLYLRNTANNGSLWTLKATIGSEDTMALPNGYLNAPVPTYDSAQPKRVNFNGALNARTQDNTANILLSSASRNLDLATNGANGLADGLTVANNTWYYVYAYSGGYVASTTNGASTLTIGTVVQKVVQLPLTLRTDGSANILPFYMVSWAGRSSHTRYSTQLNGATTGLTSSPTLIGLVSSGTYSAFSLASFVPPPSRVATLFAYSRGGGAGLLRTTGTTNEYIYDLGGGVLSRELTVLTNSSQSIDARVTSSGFDLAVTGYTINV
ncbi:MAG: hypothetical protein ACK5U7_08235 [Bacteroidota bacterium]